MTQQRLRYDGLSFVGDRECTRVSVSPRDLSSSSESSAAALGWSEALDELEGKRAEKPDAPAFGLLVHRPGSPRRARVVVLFADPKSDEPICTTFGRHPCCDVQLRDASLRHAVFLGWPAPREGEHAIEVIDLRSTSGIVLGRRSVARRFRTPGPVRFGIGSDEVTLLFAPAGARFSMEFPDELDQWIELEHKVICGLTRPAAKRMREVTNVSIVERRGVELVRRLDGVPVERGGVHLVAASARELRDGVLLGRYPRCDQHQELAKHELVSRVHALILERRGSLYAVDVGSTHGTVIVDARSGAEVAVLEGGRRVRRLDPWHTVELAGEPVAVELIEEARQPKAANAAGLEVTSPGRSGLSR